MTRNKRRGRLTVEQFGVDRLDVRELQRAGLLGEGWVSLRPALLWPRIERMRAYQYLIQLELRNQVVQQQIRVSWTRCHYGGSRPWMHCPFCQKRVAILVRALAGYCCRNCAGNPVYACQTKSTQARRHFEACKLRLRLGGVASLAAPFPERPPGMHQYNYELLRRRAEVLEGRLSSRIRTKPADYANLVYYSQSLISK
jgi:hypothetical protein